MSSEPEDTELLRRYAATRAEAAFAEVVQRHLALVYGCALRRVGGDAQLAEDVAQQVFSALARQAGEVAARGVPAGWLYTTARQIAAQTVRTERRRRAREQAAFMMTANEGAPPPPEDWERLRPVLEDTIDDLDETDRVAVVLRFFEGRSFADVGARLRLTENAARMRVERALDKLHGLLARRGIHSTTAALGVVLTGHAAVVVPATLATSVTAAALSTGAAGAGGAGALLGFMSMTKLQLGVAALIAVSGATGYLIQAETAERLRQELAGLRAQVRPPVELATERGRLEGIAAEVAALRADDAEFTRLREEAVALQAQSRARAAMVAAVANLPRLPADPSGMQYPANVVDVQPKPTRQAPPKYPAAFRTGGVQGEAMLELLVDAEGEVKRVVAVTATHGEFEAAAVEAVKQWKFEPGQKGGQRVQTLVRLPIKFTLGTEQQAATWF